MDRNQTRQRFALICATIERQKAYISRVPDPDNRYAAEGHLVELVQMRDDLALSLSSKPKKVV